MKTACVNWKDQLLEAALGADAPPELAQHLNSCAACAAELEALLVRRERIDALLSRVARGAELSPNFRARVLAAAEAGKSERERALRRWILAGTAAVLATVTVALVTHYKGGPASPEADLAALERLTQWRPPSDVFLETPGREVLRTTPRLGEPYGNLPFTLNEEE